MKKGRLNLLDSLFCITVSRIKTGIIIIILVVTVRDNLTSYKVKFSSTFHSWYQHPYNLVMSVSQLNGYEDSRN